MGADLKLLTVGEQTGDPITRHMNMQELQEQHVGKP